MTDLKDRIGELRDIVDASTPDELPAVIARRDGGVESVVDLVFDWWRSCFAPERTLNSSGIFHYAVTTPEGSTHRYVVVAERACEIAKTVDTEPNTTITVSLNDLLSIATGKVRGTQAWRSGMLEISGDVFFAMNWSEWFVSPQ